MITIILPITKEFKEHKFAAYCRLSTSRTTQLRSLEIQIKTYANMISNYSD